MTVTWDPTFKNAPADINNLSEGAAEIRTTRKAVEERMLLEHVWGAGSANTEGNHAVGSARGYYVTDPDTVPTQVGDNTNQSGRLRIVNEGTGAAKLEFCATDTGAWDIGRWLPFDACTNWAVEGDLTVAGTADFTGDITAVAAEFSGAVVIDGPSHTGSLKIGENGTVITELVIS
jgi:hypothetical protein